LSAAVSLSAPQQRLLGRCASATAAHKQPLASKPPVPPSAHKHREPADPQQGSRAAQQQQRRPRPARSTQQEQPPAPAEPLPLQPAKRQRSNSSDQQAAVRTGTRQALKSGTHRLSSDHPLRDQQPF